MRVLLKLLHKHGLIAARSLERPGRIYCTVLQGLWSLVGKLALPDVGAPLAPDLGPQQPVTLLAFAGPASNAICSISTCLRIYSETSRVPCRASKGIALLLCILHLHGRFSALGCDVENFQMTPSQRLCCMVFLYECFSIS